MSYQLSDYIKKAIPFIICLLIILLSQMPGIRFVFTLLILIPVFYFAIFRPSILNEYALFGLGLFTDLISQTPFGLFSFLFVLFYFVARLNRLFLKDLSFKNLWILFSIFSGILLLIQMFLFTLCEGSTIQTKFLFQHFIFLVLIFPLGLSLCNRLNEWIGFDE